MKNSFILVTALLFFSISSLAQKPFAEGIIVYKAQIETTDGKVYNGTYTFTFKNGRIRKELKLNNGYDDVILINTQQNTAYSLQNKSNKKYAIQLNISELENAQKKYAGYRLKEDRNTGKIIAGYTVFKGQVFYNDGSSTDIYFTPDWRPEHSVTYDRFPNAQFMPLSYTYKDDKGIVMRLEAESVSVAPVENAIFRVPADYKMISNKEYKQINH